MKKRKFMIDYIEEVDSHILVEMLGVYRDSLDRLRSDEGQAYQRESVKTSLEVIQRELRRRGSMPSRASA